VFKFSTFFVSLLACSTLLLTGALGRQPAGSMPNSPTPFTAQSDVGDAKALLGEILVRLGVAAQSDWLTATVWQTIDDGETRFEAEGRLVRGPGHRLRLDLEVKSRRRGRVVIACDGTTLWRSRHLGSEEKSVESFPVPQGCHPSAPEFQSFLRDRAVPEPLALLRALSNGLSNTKAQTGLWHSQQAARITGDWSPCEDTPADLRAPKRPRTCHVYVDLKTGYPLRIEWWGSENEGNALALVSQIEFRDLVLSPPPPPDECARLFSYRADPK
jgi:hypothetical protein